MPESASSRPAGPSLAAQPAAFTMLVSFIFCFVMYSGLTPATQEIKPKSDFNKDVQDIQDKN